MATVENEAIAVPDHLKKWSNDWANNQHPWQMEKVNPNLIAQLPNITPPSGPADTKILGPLCGQSHDLLYLVQKGYTVFGIEAIRSSIDGLNQRDNLGLEESKDSSSILRTPDGKLTIFQGDILECPIENWGPFDIIWDRASLVAMELCHREKYIEVLKRSVSVPASSGDDCNRKCK